MLDEQNIAQVINRLFDDIRAEAIVADLMEKGMQPDDFVAVPQGIFKRRYARDVAEVQRRKLSRNDAILAFLLNRDGMYDSLPEGLFHTKTASDSSSGKVSEDSQVLKREEKAARGFFLPFEQEMFLQRVKLEQEERKILSRFSERIFNDIYPNLWKIHRSVKREYVNRMVLLLHLAHKIVGNMELTAACLEMILEEPVCISQQKLNAESEAFNDQLLAENMNQLGKGSLGIDFVCGEYKYNFQYCWEVKIGPLRKAPAEEFLPGNSGALFLDCFYAYFIPVEMPVETKVTVAKKQEIFELSGAENAPILGFETTL